MKMLAVYTLISLQDYKKVAPEKLTNSILEALGDTGNFTIVTSRKELVKKSPVLVKEPQGKVPAIEVYISEGELEHGIKTVLKQYRKI